MNSFSMMKLADKIKLEYSNVQAIMRRGRCPFHRLHAHREYLRGLVDAMLIIFGYRALFDSQSDNVTFVAVKD